MKVTSILCIAAAALGAVVDAAAVSRRDGTVQIAVTRPASKQQKPAQSYLNNLKRFNPEAFAFKQAAAASSGVTLTDFSDELYTAPVTVGTNQQFTIDLDTGSADVWFHGSSCKSSDGSCGTKATQVNVSDKKLKSVGTTFSEQYGSGSVSGKVYSGPVTLGSYTAATLDFGASTAETGFSSPGAGLFGLGYSGLNSIKGGSNFVSAAKIGVFGFYLSNSADGDNGEVTLGGTDSSKYTGKITYVPNNGGSTYYQFNVAGYYQISGSTTHHSLTGNAIADTGTTQIVLTTSHANFINGKIGADSNGNISCDAKGPAVIFNFGGSTFTITSEYYILNQDGQCFSGFGGGAEDFGVQIFGDVFIRAYYTIFDITNTRIGFAQAVHP